MTVIPLLQDNYAYVVSIAGSRRVAVVDPSEAAPVAAFLAERRFELGAILCTHHHWDHVGGVAELVASNPRIAVVGSDVDQQGARIPNQTEALSDGGTFEFEGATVEAMHVPGHTLGAVAFKMRSIVFTGDTLFLAGCGRVFEGTMPMMHASLMRFASLPGDTRLYPGHEYTLSNLRFAQTVEPDNEQIAVRLAAVNALRERGEPSVPGLLSAELATNCFLRAEAPAVRKFALHGENTPIDSDQVFERVRLAKDNF